MTDQESLEDVGMIPAEKVTKDLHRVIINDDLKKLFFVDTSLSAAELQELISFLLGSINVFAWSPYDMPRVDPTITMHSLNVDTKAKPIVQRSYCSAVEHTVAIINEVDKLLEAGAIWEITYPTWLSKTVVLEKKTRSCFSLLFVIKACTQKSLLIEGKQIHALVINLGFEPIIHLQTSLIDLYSGVGDISNAHHVFDEIPIKNVVCWTALISGYVDNQKPNKALQLFRKMQMVNVEPDRVTLTVALSACVDVGALDMGEWIHGYVRRKKELDIDLCLNNALINMYAKCRDIEIARRLLIARGKKTSRLGHP
ncbi:putative pentatricopeptide repeat-containing protein At1g74400 [Camellia sinensis]|uniref:putative pentatricopeptide repeat-containing protein At1g74400 n=1 Tax=Camellia sinensis TaxID=4442 RepID=UPI0010364140|nr:putative pentatricopeptide repeat-containing protein At1g74400 [Camellia sinensis]